MLQCYILYCAARAVLERHSSASLDVTQFRKEKRKRHELRVSDEVRIRAYVFVVIPVRHPYARTYVRVRALHYCRFEQLSRRDLSFLGDAGVGVGVDVEVCVCVSVR